MRFFWHFWLPSDRCSYLGLNFGCFQQGIESKCKKGTATKSFLFCLMHFLSTVMRGNVSFAKAGKLSLIRSFLPCTMGWDRLCRSVLTYDETSMISRDFFLNICITIGTIHLRRQHSLGGERSKICQICRRIVVKKLPKEGGKGQKF